MAPVARCIRETAALPMPAEPVGGTDGDPLRLPGGAGRTAVAGDVRRGVGFAVAIKNLMYSEGFDDYSTARCRLADGGASVKFATAEVGQGFVTIAQQIARTILGVDEVDLEPMDTSIGSAGSTSASRQTWMSGARWSRLPGWSATRFDGGGRGPRQVEPVTLVVDGTASWTRSATARWRWPRRRPAARSRRPSSTTTGPPRSSTADGQGNCHTAFAFVAHRAVVDVDVDLGLVKVVQIATAQDVGRALNPLSVIGQIEGGIAQGLGLAVMEEIVITDGRIRNPSFTDYLLPTSLDMPEVVATLVEEPDPQAPLGAKGVGEPPCISVTPAIVAAIRAATGPALNRVPVRPQDIALAPAPSPGHGRFGPWRHGGLTWETFGQASTLAGPADRRRRLPARHHPRHRPRRPAGGRRARLRPVGQEPVHDERRVLHGRRRAPRRAR